MIFWDLGSSTCLTILCANCNSGFVVNFLGGTCKANQQVFHSSCATSLRVWISVGGSIRNAFCSYLQDCRVSREPMRTEKRVNEPGDSRGYESAAQTNMSLWRE
jgi:hypothetical protein